MQIGHTPVMRRHSPSTAVLLWVVTFALLIVRAADAQVHYCFDGQEPRSSFHIADWALSSQKSEGGQGALKDRDVDAVGAALAKKGPQADTLDPLPAAEVVLRLLPPQGASDHVIAIRNPSPKLPKLFLPLSRGPPV